MTLVPFAHLLGLPSKTPKRRSSKGVAAKPTFGHLAAPAKRTSTAVPPTAFGHLNTPAMSEDEAFVARAADVRRQMEGGAPPAPKPGSFAAQVIAAGKEARGEDEAFVARAKAVRARMDGRAPAKPAEPAPGSLVAQAMAVRRKLEGKPPAEPGSDSFAAQVIAAGKKARGEG